MLALSSSPATLSGASPSRTLRPPVIRESFTRLACTQKTTIGLEGCAEAKLLRADRHVNNEVHLLFSLVNKKGPQRAFVRAEEAWFTFRGADCTSRADVYEGGTLEPVEYAQCEVSDDVARSDSLHDFFTHLEQGASPTPAWP